MKFLSSSEEIMINIMVIYAWIGFFTKYALGGLHGVFD